MSRNLSVRFVGLLLTGLALAVAAVVAGRPALAPVAVAVLAVPAVGVLLWSWPQLDVDVRVSTPRMVEGDVAHVVLEITADRPVAWLDVELDPGAGLHAADGLLRRVVGLPAGRTVAVTFPLRAEAWGVLPVGRFRLVGRDRLGLFSVGTIRSIGQVVRVYPAESRLRGMARPARTVGTLGAHLSSARGDGCEYADVRTWQPGDRLRMVNWRVSARRGATWVTERHPERAAEAVILLDDTAALGPADDSTLRRAVQAAMALAEGHLSVQDRVGLVALGAPVRSVRPRAGTRQLYAIVDTLLDCREARLSGLAGGTGLLTGGLRPGTTVVALTVLADARVAEALADLRRHGHDVIAVEPAVAPIPAGALAPALARTLWDIERAARRDRLRSLGVRCVTWDGTTPLGALLGGRRAP